MIKKTDCCLTDHHQASRQVHAWQQNKMTSIHKEASFGTLNLWIFKQTEYSSIRFFVFCVFFTSQCTLSVILRVTFFKWIKSQPFVNKRKSILPEMPSAHFCLHKNRENGKFNCDENSSCQESFGATISGEHIVKLKHWNCRLLNTSDYTCHMLIFLFK